MNLWRSVLSGPDGVARAPERGGLNAPYGAPYFPRHPRVRRVGERREGLNAPYGAPCFLTGELKHADYGIENMS